MQGEGQGEVVERSFPAVPTSILVFPRREEGTVGSNDLSGFKSRIKNQHNDLWVDH